jgi:AAA15 family ATPase/GTPase
MLIRFRVANFLSYDKEQEFCMIPGKATTHSERIIEENGIKLLNFTAIYGANASGKSNLVKAIDFAKKTILLGVKHIKSQSMYCKTNKKNREQDTKFEFEIKINNRNFAYGFFIRLSELKITGEWLFELFENDQKNIFSYYNYGETIIKDLNEEYFPDTLTEFKIYFNDILNMDKSLLLTEIIKKNKTNEDYAIFKDVFNWFVEKMIVVFPNSEIEPVSRLFDGNCKLNTLDLLDYFDTGITDYKKVKIDIEDVESSIPKDFSDSLNSEFNEKNAKLLKKEILTRIYAIKNRVVQLDYNHEKNKFTAQEILFCHGSNEEAVFPFGEESDGTKRVLQLLSLYNRLNDDIVIIVDELDRSLHPKMVHKFVETYLKLASEDKDKAQLIITTHESTLMNLKNLRRDEIWFVERDENYASKIYSLDEFKVRNDKDIQKAYLWGRYGAVPLFNEFEFLKMKFNKQPQSGEDDE